MRAPCIIADCERNRKGFGYCELHYRRYKRYGDPNYYAYDRTPQERFWARVDKSGDCWIWTGNVRPNRGYGTFAISPGNIVLTHRFAYEQTKGPIPEGMWIDHRCHVKSCCNPQHLRPVTPKQNIENHEGPQKNGSLGLRGVTFDKRRGTYSARVIHNGIQHYAGAFTDPAEAAETARQMRNRLFSHNDIDRRTA